MKKGIITFKHRIWHIKHVYRTNKNYHDDEEDLYVYEFVNDISEIADEIAEILESKESNGKESTFLSLKLGFHDGIRWYSVV